MRTSVIIWLSMAISLQLAAFDTNGQGIDTEITLELKNTTLEEALRVLQSKTGMPMVYAPALVEGYDNISVSHAKRTVRAILEILLKETDLTYLERDNAIVLRRKTKAGLRDAQDATLPSLPMMGYTVSGKITDATTGDLLPGVSVLVKGTTRGTSSDAQGMYSIEVEPDEILQFSFIGFKTYEANVQSRTTIDVIMVTDVTALKEVVISTDYFSTLKEKSTMNISKVDGKEIENQPVTSLLNALVGRVPGIDITPQSGFAGRVSTIRIRGNNSLNPRGSFPLYVIDGVQIESRPLEGSTPGQNNGYDPIAGISPSDIESIEVLKDAAATAIYGSRGANGVVRITTRRAKEGQGKVNVDFNIYSGIGQVARQIDLLDAKQYLEMRHEAFENAGTTINPNSSAQADVNGIWDTTRTTNWQDVFLGGTANITDIQGSISGGSELTSFKIGGSYHKETTVFPGDFSYQRGTGDLSYRLRSPNRKFEITAGVNFGYVKNETSANASFVDRALTLAPVAPKLYNEDGSLNWELHQFANGSIRHTWINPLADLLNRGANTTTSLIASTTLGYEFYKRLRLKTLVSLTNIYNDENRRTPIAMLPPSLRSSATGSMYFVTNNRRSVMIEPQLTYDNEFGDHHVNSILGVTFQQARTIYTSDEAIGYPSDALLGSKQGAASINSIADDNLQYKYTSLYLHVGYDFRGKYLLDIIGRRDGSSRFGPGNRFGNFGAVGAGWIFSEESFFKNNFSFVNYGKVRSSYGITGNDQIGDYQYLDTYQILSSGYQDGVSLIPRALYNPDYAWEETVKFEAALELGLLNNRITIDGSWYRNVSSNQLIDYRLSAQTGFYSVLSNFDATIENTGWEFVLTTKVFAKEHFAWTVSANLSAPRNKLLKFDGIQGSAYEYIYKVGEPLSIQRRFLYKGVNAETGAYQVEDINSDGSFDESDKKWMNPLGRTSYYGVMNNLIFRNFELAFLFQFSNNPIDNFMFASQPGLASNQPTEVLNRWRQPGDNAKYQRFITGPDPNYQYAVQSDFNVTDATFARLKTLSLSYNVARQLLDKIQLRQAQIYLQGQNLFTVTKFKGLDPETGNTLPQLRTITIGLRLKI